MHLRTDWHFAELEERLPDSALPIRLHDKHEKAPAACTANLATLGPSLHGELIIGVDGIGGNISRQLAFQLPGLIQNSPESNGIKPTFAGKTVQLLSVFPHSVETFEFRRDVLFLLLQDGTGIALHPRPKKKNVIEHLIEKRVVDLH